jgi:uncharacterized protein YihD (DUF1040 family)
MFNHKWFNLYFEKPVITGTPSGKDVTGTFGDDKTDEQILADDPETNKDDKEKPKGPDDKEVDEEDEKLLESEEDEEEIKLDEVDDDNTEDEPQSSRQRPSLKDIIKKIPEAEKVFKEFPQLRDAYYREAKFSQLFSTVEDAEVASTKAESLDAINELVMGGSSKEVLESIRKESPESFKKFASNFLPTLASIDDGVFTEIAMPVVNTVIRNLARMGEKNKDNNMISAAKIMAHYLHGSYEIPEAEAKRNADPELEKERKKLQDERNELNTTKYREFEGGVHTRTSKQLNKLITEGLDTTNSLSDFTKSKIIEEVIDRVGSEIQNDAQFQNQLNKLWKTAQQSGFKGDAADRIIIAYLSRAKRLIPNIRAKVKTEALGGSKRRSTNSSDTTRRESNNGRGSERRVQTDTDPKKVNWKKQSDMDILNS